MKKSNGQWHKIRLRNPFGGKTSKAREINNHQDVIGLAEANDPNVDSYGFISPACGDEGLVRLEPSPKHSYVDPWDINDSGDVAGYAMGSLPGVSPDALLWPGKSPHPIVLPALTSNGALAFGINDKGMIVGYSTDSSGMSNHAVVWTTLSASGSTAPGYNVTRLSGFPRKSTSWAWSVNNHGDIVGSYTHKGVKRAFLHRGGTMIDLSRAMGLTSAHYMLSEAHSINDAGVIVGRAQVNGVQRGFILIP